MKSFYDAPSNAAYCVTLRGPGAELDGGTDGLKHPPKTFRLRLRLRVRVCVSVRVCVCMYERLR